MNALEVAGLRLTLGGREILREVSFTLPAGEVVAVIGPNGAGKSSMLRCLVRALRPQAGEVRVMGDPLSSLRQAELARRVAYVPQVEEAENPFTVEEFVLLGRYPHLSPFTTASGEDRDAVQAALRDTGMEPFAGRRMDTLSGGERQKAALAAALAQGAPVLLLDEPTAFLDPRHQDEVFRLLQRAHGERGTAILFVTHDLNAALAYAGRVVALAEGKVAWEGPAKALADDAVLLPLYGKSFTYATHPVSGRPVVLP